ncbi:hypothetical protein [Roseibium sp. RKSG952]|uniref:hypothetical protein n=1 Tax=Roseibium sp. RKSG952 TaxID=2529384 RepID=UPI0012BBE82D|nr:hypothetical protein [Roseibium sp. RKSG952]MTH95399.1 hypothetical protein [Roseibium sp. RKSG952]
MTKSNMNISVEMIERSEDLTTALMIRASVFVGENAFYDLEQERDGNDHAATHLLARVEGVPCGTMRIRYFAKIAVFERLAVTPPYRKKKFGPDELSVTEAIQSHALGLIREKGYEQWTCMVADWVTGFWEKAANKYGRIVEVEDSKKIVKGGQNGTIIHGILEREKLGDVDFEFPSTYAHPNITKKEGDLVRRVWVND